METEHSNDIIALLQCIHDCGPQRCRDIADTMGWAIQAVQALVTYSRAHNLVIGERTGPERPRIYSLTEAGKRRIRMEVGEPTPPRTISYKPWQPMRELEWPGVRTGGDDFLRHETRGYA